MWHDWPRHRRLLERLEDIACLVESQSIDVLILQEVTRTRYFHSDEWLSQRLGMSFVYSRANGHSTGIGFEEGLAILSRFPIGSPLINQLSNGKNPFVRRVALGTTIFTPCGEIVAFSVHLGLINQQNAEQQSRLQAWVDLEAGERPALIGGDFNSDEESPQIKNIQSRWLDTFRHLYPHANGITTKSRLLGVVFSIEHVWIIYSSARALPDGISSTPTILNLHWIPIQTIALFLSV